MSEESIENIAKSNSLFASTFVNHYILPDVFLMDTLINNISIPKKVINIYISIYFLHNKSMAKRFKYRFYIR